MATVYIAWCFVLQKKTPILPGVYQSLYAGGGHRVYFSKKTYDRHFWCSLNWTKTSVADDRSWGNM